MVKRSFEIIGGVLLLILGVIGWLVPILPGTVFFFAGIVMITPHHGKRIIDWIKITAKKNHKKLTKKG